MDIEVIPEVKSFIYINSLITRQIFFALKDLKLTFDDTIQKLFDKIENTHNVIIRHSIGDEPIGYQNHNTNRFNCFYCSTASIDIHCSSVLKLLIHVLFMHDDINVTCKFTSDRKLNISSYRVMMMSYKEEESFAFGINLRKKVKARRSKRQLITDTFKKAFADELKAVKNKKNNYNFQSDDSEEEEKTTIEKGFNKELKPEEIKYYLRKTGNTYYHSTNLFQPIDSDSLLEESEKEIDDKPIKDVEEKAIDEFEDIDDTDKQYFKLWNAWVREYENEKRRRGVVHHILNETNFAKFVSDFLTKHKFALMSLRHNFLMHLITLQVYNLITSNDICLILLQLDQNILTIN